MNWLIENKEWVFSGIGVFIIGGIIAIFKKSKKKKTLQMKQRSGSNSKNIQIGGDFNAR
jgi:hypothetical protein